MPTPLVLAIDLGTSSTRTALFDINARRLPGATAQQTYPLLSAVDGTAELEPGALLGALRTCLAETLARRRTDPLLREQAIAAISVSCFWHSLVGTNTKGEAITRVITWADSRPRDDAARLRRDREEEKVHAKTGCMLRASYWPAKLAWLWRTDERLFNRVHQWMSPAEWLQLQLAGAANCAIGMATGTGLFDPSAIAWDSSMLRLAKITPEKLRPLSDEPTPVGGTLAAEFPELRGVPWFPAVGDGAASNLGSGATRPGVAAINVGTSAALRVLRASPKGEPISAPLGLFCYRVDERRYLVGGPVSNAGNLRAWCMRELKLTDGPEVETALAARPGPQHGLTVLPFWTAERAPLWNEDDLGAIHGLRQSTTALDILQAITEATYHRLARIHELLMTQEKTAPKIIVSGGIQKSASSLLRLANVLGQPLYASDEPEASIRGAAILALERLGFPVPEIKLAHPVKPQIKYAREYKEQRERQRLLEQKLAGFGQ
jgi:gluconokinase